MIALHIQCICCCDLSRGFTNMQMHYYTYTKHSHGGKTGLQAYGVVVFHLSNGYALLGVFVIGSNLQKRSIPHLSCGGRLETIPHLSWTCSFTTTFVQRLNASLSHRFPGRKFGKHFWLFGQVLCSLSKIEVSTSNKSVTKIIIIIAL